VKTTGETYIMVLDLADSKVVDLLLIGWYLFKKSL